ncbi:MAG: hypothetical protein IJ243_01565 [Prevotella sp.]|nr:hypothetical protein [Prevotella sp.]
MKIFYRNVKNNLQKCQNLSQKILFTERKQFSAKNGRFRALGWRCPMKNRAAKDEDLHTHPAFVQVFRSNFATFRVFVSTPNFQKSTPNFQKSLTFFLNEAPFLPKSNQPADNQPFRKHSKTSVFSSKSCFREEFLKYGGQKWPFCQYISKK